MKTIKDAVIELDGKLPNRTYTKYSNAAGWYISRDGKLSHEAQDMWFEPEEFESEAKRMGYINGYLWGKEYPTNGKRPDLPNDVLILGKYGSLDRDWGFVDVEAVNAAWGDIFVFKITDPRYKPVDEVSETNLAFAKVGEAAGKLAADMVVAELSVSHSSIDGIHAGDKISIEGLKRVSTSWYERGEHPAIGSKVTIVRGNTDLSGFGKSFIGQECTVRAIFKNQHGRDIVSVERPDGACCCFVLDVVEPAKTEREKVIEAAMLIASQCQATDQVVYALHKAEMLVLPPKKSDTNNSQVKE